MKLNINAWNLKRIDLEDQLKKLQESISRGGTRTQQGCEYLGNNRYQYKDIQMTFSPGMGTHQDYERLKKLKLEATMMYQLRAHGRGRVHLKGQTLEEQGKSLAELAPKELLQPQSTLDAVLI